VKAAARTDEETEWDTEGWSGTGIGGERIDVVAEG
jgi:hypothetical protein